MAESTSPKSNRRTISGRVERIFDHTTDARSLFLRVAAQQKLKFIPGQFISVSIPLGDETRTRPYTIASDPANGELIEICFNRVPGGRGVAWLFERTVGDSLEFIGPFGAFTMDRAPEIDTVFIAESTAIAPIRPMLHLARGRVHAMMFLLYAASRPQHILYRAELEELAASDANFGFETIIASSGDLYQRLHDEAERRWVNGDGNRARQFYICGVGKGVILLRDLLRGSGYERRTVHYEQW